MKGKKITQAAMIAALYVAVTLLFLPISFGAGGVMQVRISEALTVLAGITPVAVPGLFVGCVIANIIGGLGLLDIVLGSLATLAAAYLSWRLRSKMWLVPLPPVIVNAVVVGIYLAFIMQIPVWLSIFYVGAGQIISCYLLGIPLFLGLKKWNVFL